MVLIQNKNTILYSISGKKFPKNLEYVRLHCPDYKADAVVLFSGGLDSTIAASIYAENNPDKKILLVTFVPSYLLYPERSKLSAKELIKKYPNIIKHLIIPIPPSIVNKFFSINYKEPFIKYRNCQNCFAIMNTMTVYLIKNIFGAQMVITGTTFDDLENNMDIAMKKFNLVNSFYETFSIKLSFPVMFNKKSDLLDLAKKIGFSDEIQTAFNKNESNYLTQGLCILDQFNLHPDIQRSLIRTNKKIETYKNIFEYSKKVLSDLGF